MSMFDQQSADTSIDRQIEKLCDKLEMSRPGSTEFDQLLEAITKLRAAQNPVIVQKSQ